MQSSSSFVPVRCINVLKVMVSYPQNPRKDSSFTLTLVLGPYSGKRNVIMNLDNRAVSSV